MLYQKFIILFLGVASLFFLTSFYETYADNTIPTWLKTNAKAWSEGIISDKEYITTLQYLVDLNLLQINQDKQENSEKTDVGKRATKFVVHINSQEFGMQTYYSFEKFIHGIRHIDESPAEDYEFKTKAAFRLESIPSTDKEDYYKFVSMYINPGKEPEQFDVKVDVVTEHGTVIQQWDYKDCVITSYWTFFADTSYVYMISNADFTPEIRDRADFSCSGLKLVIP